MIADRIAFLVFGCLVFTLSAASAAQGSPPSEHHVDWTLRGGFDTNPNDAAGGRSSPVVSAGIDYLYRAEKDGRALSLSLGARGDAYSADIRLPTDELRFTLETGSALGEASAQRLTASFLRETEDGTRRTTAALRQRIERRFGPFKAFASVEGKGQTINEVNVLFDGYLPSSQQFATATVTPGLAWTGGFGEVGVSVAASRVRHLSGKDYLGLDRDQHRVQPFLFATLAGRGVRFEGSVSHLVARFDNRDYGPFARILYDARLTFPAGPVEVGLQAARFVRDTTFPTAEFEVTETWEARATRRLSDAAAVSGFVRNRRKSFDGPDLDLRTLTAGIDAERRLSAHLTLAATAALRRAAPTGGSPTTAGVFTLALTRRIDLR